LKGLNVNKEKNPDATKAPGLSAVRYYVILFKLPSSILPGNYQWLFQKVLWFTLFHK